MLSVLRWWVVSSALGLAALPIAWRLLARLPDRGYGIARALGLMATGYVLWLGASLRVFDNDVGGAVISLVVVMATSAVLMRGRWGELKGWLRQHRRSIFWMEGVFLTCFVLWAFVRSNSPEIVATEKPMELAFLNATLRSRHFPPLDPWLSGYGISYYYFGYVILALMTRLSGVTAGVAFNLGISFVFALTALGSYSLLYNLIGGRGERVRHAAPLLAVAFVLLTGNLEGFLDFLHSQQVFWKPSASGGLDSSFWRWLDIKELNTAPAGSPSPIPTRGGWWWWRASRVVHDRTLAGADVEVIDEFPFFSFVLADNHPHVLALPFVLLAITATYQVFLAGSARRMAEPGGLTPETALSLRRPEFWFAAWLYGGLAFLNVWDFPIQLSILVAVLAWLGRGTSARQWAIRVGSAAVRFIFLGVMLYLPWYLSFSSQASGLLPNLIFPSRLAQSLVMFGVLLVPILAWLAWRQPATRSMFLLLFALPLADIVVFLLLTRDMPRAADLVVSLIIAVLITLGCVIWMTSQVRSHWRIPGGRLLLAATFAFPVALLLTSWALGLVVALVSGRGLVQTALEAVGASGIEEAIQAVIQRRLGEPWTPLLLGSVLGGSLMLLLRPHAGPEADEPEMDQAGASSPAGEVGYPDSEGETGGVPVWAFVAILISVGALLVLGPEFLYLRDLFGTRMNTVFKFYYAAWVLWGIAAAYAVYELRPRAATVGELAKGVIIFPLVLGMFYPVMSTWTRAEGFRPRNGRTLDGIAHLGQSSPQDLAAIRWINENLELGIMVEAVEARGGSYTDFARISAHTGFPTVLGWEFHEFQWRGTTEIQGSRKDDIRRLYLTRDWEEALAIMDQYGIRYIYVGDRERATYPQIELRKFEGHLDIVYNDLGATIYARRGAETSDQ